MSKVRCKVKTHPYYSALAQVDHRVNEVSNEPIYHV